MRVRRDWLLIALFSLAAGMLAGALLPRAQAEEPCRLARYQISATGTDMAYRLDTYTGEVVIISPHGYLRKVEPYPSQD